ncbi:histidine phosphatase family protein [Sphingomonas lacunae]|uniref:Histidine phosphatase family protein n=1 Tax=Sphingomonas lacunae TaxID=2698828 RepID=A0A6M4ATB2_9SPHN|nr:histidine phosphatase family protein [Sphingomonas lacunae]QJQ32323.1 histidine phosphatase family protein [Sphingomonas lacunae]
MTSAPPHALPSLPPVRGRLFIARHGETVFNAARRMQGQGQVHTPLTRTGFAQADAMGAALARWLAEEAAAGRRAADAPLELHASSAGRALQTLAVMAEHLPGADWHSVRADRRLEEIDVGDWSGLYYPDLAVEHGSFICPDTGLFTRVGPGGESYGDVAARLSDWLGAVGGDDVDRLVVMHGMSSRVLRGLLLGRETDARFGAPAAPGIPQGSFVLIDCNALNNNGNVGETLIRLDPHGEVE